jgi:hypothetical protein
VPVFLPYWLYQIHTVAAVAAFVAGVLLIFVYTGAASLIARDISDYGNPGFREFFGYLKESWGTSLAFGFIVVAHIAILMVLSPSIFHEERLRHRGNGFHLLVQRDLGPFMPILLPAQSEARPKSSQDREEMLPALLRQHGLHDLPRVRLDPHRRLSSFTAFLLPGFAAVLTGSRWVQAQAPQVRHLEKNPEADRRKIPWEALLVEEEERVGKRTLRGMIFPWKE